MTLHTHGQIKSPLAQNPPWKTPAKRIPKEKLGLRKVRNHQRKG